MKITDLCKSYSDKVVYSNFNLEIEDGKTTCILGESGSGKTTLLNVLAGLTDYTGEVDRVKCSYIFQQPRLIPNLTVYKNLLAVCPDGEKVKTMLKEAEMEDKINSYPNSLSGGQAQRVSILRAFLYDSKAVLMDEPFTSLDIKLKIRMMLLFSKMQRESGRTAVFVTHDIDEAVFLADRIIVISDGRIKLDERVDDRFDYGVGTPLREKLFACLASE
ncbi:MAG: ABC transporter ATP-binding protein [Candidatus Coproplasma sp.]